MKHRPVTKEYSDNWDKIFRNGKTENQRRMLTEEEKEKVREDLRQTVETCRRLKDINRSDT